MTNGASTYDLQQDQRLSTLEGLVTTTYTPPSGNETSFPVIGSAVDDKMWQQMMLGMGDGVLDQGGRPYWLRSLDNATNTAKLTVSTTTKDAQAVLRGFYHRMQADITISLPPVSAATNYYIALEYDPTRHGQPGGPIRVQTKTSLTTTSGKANLLLWTVPRNPNQLLSDTTPIQGRQKVAPTSHVDYATNLPDPSKQLWGAQCYIRYGQESGCIYIAIGASEDSGPTRWVNINNQGWENLSLGGGYSAFAGGQVPQYRWDRGDLVFRGQVRRADNSDIPVNPSVFAWVSGVDLRPFQAFSVAATNAYNCRVETAQGTSAYDNLKVMAVQAGVKWFSLDGVRIPGKGAIRDGAL